VPTNLDRRELAAILLGGATGALLRVWLVVSFNGSAGTWPWVTFSVNVTGAFAVGYLVTRLQDRLPQSTYRRPLLATGFCGAFTTFSTMQLEVLRMLEVDRYGLAAAYCIASVLAGYLAVWVASASVRRARMRPWVRQ
jgi:fluoride exporter